jgi:hypothetical protein
MKFFTATLLVVERSDDDVATIASANRLRCIVLLWLPKLVVELVLLEWAGRLLSTYSSDVEWSRERVQLCAIRSTTRKRDAVFVAVQ